MRKILIIVLLCACFPLFASDTVKYAYWYFMSYEFYGNDHEVYKVGNFTENSNLNAQEEFDKMKKELSEDEKIHPDRIHVIYFNQFKLK